VHTEPGQGSGTQPAATSSQVEDRSAARHLWVMALTLRLTEALRRRAEAEQRSMRQVALAAIDAYVQRPVPHRRAAVPVSELMRMFGGDTEERAGSVGDDYYAGA
jgi:hypothetical protein